MPMQRPVALSVLAIVALACSGAQKEDELPLTDVETTGRPPPTEETPSGEGDASDLNDAQKEQIKVALRRGGEKAAECNKVTGSSVTGEGEVQVVLDGKKGYVVDATVGAPFAGTPIEDCIKRGFIDEVLVPFDGTLTVPYTIKIEAKAPAADPKKDPKKAPPKK
jgi:hypothetical protein